MSVNPTTDLAEMVLVPAGPFQFGEDGELTYLPPFLIDRFPVTVGRYREFLLETGHGAPGNWPTRDGPSGLSRHPVTGVSFFDAMEFCRWMGHTLPTEPQWEKAARGTDGRPFPWGERFNVRNLNSRGSHVRGTTPVDRYPGGVSPFDVWDLCGNAWEWTDTWFDLAGDLKVLKGGCHALTKEHARASHRHFNDPRFANNLTGFRTVECL